MTTPSLSERAEEQGVTRGVIAFFVRHRVAANLLMLIMLITGAVGLLRLSAQSLPSFPLNFVIVQVEWPGAAAEDVEQSITTPLEQELRNLDRLKEMRSTSAIGFAYIALEFKTGTPMGEALDQVNNLVSQVRNLPLKAKEPQVSKFFYKEEVATLVVSSRGDFSETRALVHRFERELLDRGIAKIDFFGLPEQELLIQVGVEQLSNLKLSLVDLGNKILSHSQDIPAGVAGKSVAGRELRGLEQARDVPAFEQLPVVSDRSGRLLRVGDIAEVEKRPRSNAVQVFYNGQPAVEMQLLRFAQVDSLKMAEVLDLWLKETRPTLPDAVEIQVYNEAWALIEERINLLLVNGLTGLILVVAVLYLFLNGRVAFWVAAGIPVAYLGAFYLLHIFGASIDMVSLFALVMALGIIVDDAIVVGEDAYSRFQGGKSALAAAEGGAQRMWVPVLSSSLSTIAAFLPLMLISGMIGDILFVIPLVIICVILASLAESFLILPHHLKTSLAKAPPTQVRKGGFDRWLERFREGAYRKLVTWVLRQRMATLTLVIASFVLSIGLLLGGRVPFTFFVAPAGTAVSANVKFAASTPPEQVAAFAQRMEAMVWQVNDDLKQQYSVDQDIVRLAVVRRNMALFEFAPGLGFTTGEQYAMVQVELAQPDFRPVSNQVFIDAWREALELPPGVEQLVIKEALEGPPGRDIDIFLAGSDSGLLKGAAEQLVAELGAYSGVYNIRDDLPYGKEQLIYELSPLGESLGLDISQVGRQLQAAFDGFILQSYYEGPDEVEVKITLPDEERHQYRRLDQLPIVTPAGEVVPLSNVVNFRVQRGTELLRHTQGLLGVHITADVNAVLTNANKVVEALAHEVIPQVIARFGVTAELKGRAQEQAETGADMAVGAVLGVSLIYMILAWVFASYSWPLAVMVTVPLSLAGAIFGHWILGIDMTLLSIFGFFGLSGIVINDAIILISGYKELREQGVPVDEAIVESSCRRFRAVVLTSLTTIAGLLPLIVDSSTQAQFLKPMAVSICFGLAFATLLVLIVIPLLLSYIEAVTAFLDLRSQWFYKYVRRGRGKTG